MSVNSDEELMEYYSSMCVDDEISDEEDLDTWIKNNRTWKSGELDTFLDSIEARTGKKIERRAPSKGPNPTPFKPQSSGQATTRTNPPVTKRHHRFLGNGSITLHNPRAQPHQWRIRNPLHQCRRISSSSSSSSST